MMQASNFGRILYLLATVVLTLVFGQNHSQYCYTATSIPTSFCVSFGMYPNETSGHSDLYLTVSGYPTASNGKGWLAIGFGDGMIGSLMFMFWTEETPGVPHFSARTADAHTEPFENDDIPNTAVLSGTYAGQHELTASVVCYACDKWPALNVHTEVQKLIWASNYLQPSSEERPWHPEIHQLHDVFYVDMTSIPIVRDPENHSMWPSIKGAENSGTWDNITPSQRKDHLRGATETLLSLSMIMWHEVLLISSHMIALPYFLNCARRQSRSQLAHLTLYGGLLLNVIGSLCPLATAKLRVDIHQVGGACVVTASTAFYIFNLHKHFLWVGELLVAACILCDGFALSDRSLPVRLTWFAVVVSEALVYYWAWYRFAGATSQASRGSNGHVRYHEIRDEGIALASEVS